MKKKVLKYVYFDIIFCSIECYTCTGFFRNLNAFFRLRPKSFFNSYNNSIHFGRKTKLKIFNCLHRLRKWGKVEISNYWFLLATYLKGLIYDECFFKKYFFIWMLRFIWLFWTLCQQFKFRYWVASDLKIYCFFLLLIN